MGRFRYTQLIFHLLEQNPNLTFRELACQVLQKTLGKVPLPLDMYINRDYRRIAHMIEDLLKRGYLRASLADSSVFRGFLFHLHRSLRKKGELTIQTYNNLEFRLMDPKEMIEGSLLSIFIVADYLFTPVTFKKIIEKTGYRETTILSCLSGLRAMGLIEKQKARYSLKGDQKKLLEFFKVSKNYKLRWIRRIRLYLAAMKFIEKGFLVEEISRQADIPRNTVKNWKEGTAPKLRLQTAELFVTQQLINQNELKIWEKKEYVSNRGEPLFFIWIKADLLLELICYADRNCHSPIRLWKVPALVIPKNEKIGSGNK